MPGQLTRSAIAAQPDWLRQVPERVGGRRVPADASVLFTGCGTSYHAALACGRSAQALEVVLGNAPEADVLIAISHEGETRLTLEAVESFAGETWLVTGVADSPIGHVVENVVVATPRTVCSASARMFRPLSGARRTAKRSTRPFVPSE